MTTMSDDWTTYRGPAPIFAQPHLALFPGYQQLLRVASKPLRRIIRDVLRGNKLLAVAAGEADDTQPGGAVCLARVVAPAFLSPDAHHVLLEGVARARIVAPAEEAVGWGEVEAVADGYPEPPAVDRGHRSEELLTLFRGLFPHVQRNDLFQLWGDTQLPLGVLCDVIAGVLPVETAQKWRLLAETNVDLRSDLLLAELKAMARAERNRTVAQSAIPAFSAN